MGILIPILHAWRQREPAFLAICGVNARALRQRVVTQFRYRPCCAGKDVRNHGKLCASYNGEAAICGSCHEIEMYRGAISIKRLNSVVKVCNTRRQTHWMGCNIIVPSLSCRYVWLEMKLQGMRDSEISLYHIAFNSKVLLSGPYHHTMFSPIPCC